MNHPDDVWAVTHDDGTLEVFDDPDTARNAMRDDTNPFLEKARIQRTPRTHDLGTRRRTWASAPQLTVPAHWADPDDAA